MTDESVLDEEFVIDHLSWGLKYLAMWGESSCPHVRREAKMRAIGGFEDVAEYLIYKRNKKLAQEGEHSPQAETDREEKR